MQLGSTSMPRFRHELGNVLVGEGIS
jgi:hypothetical protein